jgi:hypothetical protein
MREQSARYRAAGQDAAIIERTPRRLAITVSDGVPETVVEELVAVERECCPFFSLEWDPSARRLAVTVSNTQHEPALEAIAYSLGFPSGT